MGRRPKIDRNIGTPGEGQIVRIDIYRTDDDGTRFKTSMSIDPASFRFAVALHGGSDAARDWLKDVAETLWDDDRERRRAAASSGQPYSGDISISREVHRHLMEIAESLAATGGTAGIPPSPKRRRRNASARGDRMAGVLVELILHEDNKTLSGKVLSGRFEGRALRDLSLRELLELLAEASEFTDDTDARLLTSFLNHRYPEWQTQTDNKSDTLREDLELLGLSPDADVEQVRSAHKRLMLKIHPDQGGTEALAKRVNLARDRILAARA